MAAARKLRPEEAATVAGPASSEPAPPAAQLPRELPAPFGRYRLLKLLGRGGMGAVYLAQDTQLDRPVALKVPHLETEGARVLERFYREARAAATILHPNICPLHDVGEINGIPYLTMAYVEGKSLAEFAAARPLTPRQSALLVRKLALGLQEAHKKGVIHRDLKPSNVMIDKRGEPIIMDFGLARRARKGDPRLTQQGSVLGTPAYMPPEQVSGNIDAMGPACDIYSLGVILYELLAGRLPFAGDVMAMLSQVLLDEPEPPSALRPGLDPDLEAICLKAMAKKAGDRYASMADFAAALTDHLRGKTATSEEAPLLLPSPTEADVDTEAEGIRVSRMGGLRSVAQLPAQPPTAKDSGDRPRRSRRRKKARQGVPAWVWPVGAGGLVVLLVLGWIILRPAKPGTTQPDNAGKTAGDQEPGFRNRLTANEKAAGWKLLFDGKTTNGWHAFRGRGVPDKWKVIDGALVVSPKNGKNGGDIVTDDDFGSFELSFEWKVTPGANSGVIYLVSESEQAPYFTGQEYQVLDNTRHPDGRSRLTSAGSCYALYPPSEDATRPVGEWNEGLIVVRGNHVEHWLNGKKVVTYQRGSDDWNRRVARSKFNEWKTFGTVTRGKIDLQDHGDEVAFRSIKIRPLKRSIEKELPATRSGQPAFVPLFNGNDLAGWEVESGARDRWWAAVGDLVAAGADRPADMGWLLTQKDYADFVLRFEFLLSQGGNSGVTLRAAPGEKKHLEIQILDDPRYPTVSDTARTGALYGLALDQRAALRPQGEWNQMEIEARGRSLRVSVNGQETLRTNLDRFAAQADRLSGLKRASGRIGLQNWDHAVRFRNIQIQELSAP